jgi:hypothetical protein
LTEATIRKTAGKAGRLSVVLPTKIHGHRLPLGSYRVTITPADNAGHRGRTVTYSLVLARG